MLGHRQLPTGESSLRSPLALVTPGWAHCRRLCQRPLVGLSMTGSTSGARLTSL